MDAGQPAHSLEVGWHGEGQIASVPRKGGTVRMLTKGRHALTMGNLSADGKTMALTSTTATAPPEVHLGRITATSISTSGRTNLNADWCRQHAVQDITSRWVRTADGTRVQVWTMMPVGAKRDGTNRYPAVLEIHGGPHAQYGVGFFHEFQVLASAGYLVVFSNPRGSKGYGRDHCAAIRGQWGTADWTDMQAVIAHMREHPRVNAQRMAVMGGSYGGYMTNWVIGHTTEFAAAITDRCVSNLHSMMGNSDFPNAPDKYFPGNAWSAPEKLWEQSPLRLAGNVKTPTLVIHSEGDLRCNVEQAEQYYTAPLPPKSPDPLRAVSPVHQPRDEPVRTGGHADPSPRPDHRLVGQVSETKVHPQAISGVIPRHPHSDHTFGGRR